MHSTEHDLDPAAVREALRNVLESQFFHASAQCSSLLRYIVEKTLACREEHLRERVIGCEVFGRSPDYDTGNDHVVRSRASEVRKRLAQFYQGAGTSVSIRIHIPSGSYRATFENVQTSLPHDESAVEGPKVGPSDLVVPRPSAIEPVEVAPLKAPVVPRRSHRVLAAWLFAIGLVTGLWITQDLWRPASTFDRFWAPMIRSSKPVLIYCGGGFVYKLSDSFLDDYRLKHQLKSTRREFYADLKHGETLNGADLIPDRNFVPFGDLASTARIASLLTRADKTYDLRYGDDVAFAEFHSSAVIFVGGLNNSWALRVTRNLRYVLEEDDRIVDQWHKETRWVQKADPDNQTRDDYAVISRLNQSETGGFVLSVAGIRMYGTRAATDLISDPAQVAVILRDAPRGWAEKNMQIVIHTKTQNDIPVSVNVEAVHFW